jgi:hypothetical protein
MYEVHLLKVTIINILYLTRMYGTNIIILNFNFDQII